MGPMSERVERQATRMHEMLKVLNVDGARLARIDSANVYAEARARCLLCTASKQCLDWLDDEQRSGRPTFCPSLDLFESCKRKD